MYNYFKKGLAVLTTLAIFATGSLSAGAYYKKYEDKVRITSHSSDTYDYHVNVNYCLDVPASVTLAIYEDEGRRTSTDLVDTIVDEEYRDSGCHTEDWNIYVDKYDDLYYALTVEGMEAYDTYGEDYEAGWIDASPVKVSKKYKKKTSHKYYDRYDRDDRYDRYDRYRQCGDFYDVDDSDFYCEAIEWAADEGIFNGYSDDSFRPEQSINRAEALKVIFEAFGVNVYDRHAYYANFKDVQNYSWYKDYVATAYHWGIANGYSDGTFRPAQAVSRVAALKMLLDTAKEFDGLRLNSQRSNKYSRYNGYRDTQNSADTRWYQQYVDYSYENELSSDEDYFYPDYAMTRGELAYMLYRYFETR